MMPAAIRACLRVQGTISRVRRGLRSWEENEFNEYLNNRSAQMPSSVTLRVHFPSGVVVGHWSTSARFMMRLVHDEPVDLNEVLLRYIVEPNLGLDDSYLRPRDVY